MVAVPGMEGVDLETDRFENGAFRSAFRAVVTNSGYRGYPPGTRLVFKALRAGEYNQGERLNAEDVEAQAVLRRYCDRFNRARLADVRLRAIVGHIIRFPATKRNSAGRRVICRGEKVLVEEMIDGAFQKFNSNCGWASKRHALPQFFSHWSWVRSRGRYLVCDLQGARVSGAFVFTDPAILSRKARRFGMADLGPEGVRNWFKMHECNSMCKKHGIADIRP